ncbi:MAG: hypothetical protein WCD63_09600, partial [Terrimicrobiaceae bacterium]
MINYPFGKIQLLNEVNELDIVCHALFKKYEKKRIRSLTSQDIYVQLIMMLDFHLLRGFVSTGARKAAGFKKESKQCSCRAAFSMDEFDPRVCRRSLEIGEDRTERKSASCRAERFWQLPCSRRI